MIRQGDILLVPASLPEGYEKRNTNSVIVGYGEATGHSHVLDNAVWVVAPETTEEDLRRFANGEMLDTPVFVEVSEGGMLRHQEHDALTIVAGVWRVIRQREYTPAAIRSVVD